MKRNTMILIGGLIALFWLNRKPGIPGQLSQEEFDFWLDRRFGTEK